MEHTDFEIRKLFRGRMEILLPRGLVDMPDYAAKKKYPSKFRPPVIIMNEDTTVNYLFNLIETPLPKDELVNAAKGLYTNLKRTQPEGKFGEIEITDRVEGQVAWFSYVAQVLDAKLFQAAYVTDIHGKVMYGGFNCLLEDRDIWEEQVLYSIRSIQEVKNHEN